MEVDSVEMKLRPSVVASLNSGLQGAGNFTKSGKNQASFLLLSSQLADLDRHSWAKEFVRICSCNESVTSFALPTRNPQQPTSDHPFSRLVIRS